MSQFRGVIFVLGEHSPGQPFRLLRRFLPKRLQPLARGVRKRIQRVFGKYDEPYFSVFPYTQAHIVRQENLLRLARHVEKNLIPGVIVECGVLDGGTAALMAYGTRQSGREVHLFDSWEGLPNTTVEDGDEGQVWAGQVVGNPGRVIAIMRRLGIDLDRLHFHKGWFRETFPIADIDRVALLHVDADFYESVRLTLGTWVPHVSPGGYIQIDDYSAFVGCGKAVDEFLLRNPLLKLEEVGTHTKAFFIRIPEGLMCGPR
jgi:O-methyltransferase